MNYWRWGQTLWPLSGVESLSLHGVQVTITGIGMTLRSVESGRC